MIAKRQDFRPFGEHLRIERRRLGVNQTTLAEVGGVSKATQVAYEAGSTRPDAAYLAKVADAGVDVYWLLTGRRSAPTIQWGLLFEIRDLIDEWAAERGKQTSQAERDGLLRNLYAQFCSERQIDPEQLAATFRLVG
ncbi:helix-turn-helix domain-containing protein [Lysobacter sp. A286]